MLERLNLQYLKIRKSLIQDSLVPKDPILIFTLSSVKDKGIGNFISLMPLVKSLEGLNLCVTGVCDELKEIAEFNGINLKPYQIYRTSINNFLCQRTEDIKTILNYKIPCRIGHKWDERLKYSWAFNILQDADPIMRESESNLLLLKPFNRKYKSFKLLIPNKRVPKYDIVIQPFSAGNSCKNWDYYQLIWNLSKDFKITLVGSKAEHRQCQELADKCIIPNDAGYYDLTETANIINKSRLFIGNDGGLAKIASALGKPTIQIFNFTSDHIGRCSVNGINLITPDIKTVEFYVRNYLCQY